MALSWLSVLALAGSLCAPVASAASLALVASFGVNPSNAEMHIYVPDKLASKPAIIVALHGCSGSGPAYFGQVKFNQWADQLGFVAIYPSATHDYNCWDGATNATLTHNGGGDSLAIVNMVKYTLDKYGGDSTKVFVTGSSSGGIMSNVLAGAYPDVFAAAAPISGMPYGCLLGSPASSPQAADQTCAQGGKILPAEEWAARVRAGYPGYNGPRPRMQLWHGEADFYVHYTNLVEMVKEWSTVLEAPWVRNETDTPLPGYTKMVFGDGTKLEAYSASGVGHVVPTHEQTVLEWFGLL